MSLRWRATGGELLCAAKHEAQENDTYIDDNLHYQLSVELKIITPQADEHESGVWHWVNLWNELANERSISDRLLERIAELEILSTDLEAQLMDYATKVHQGANPSDSSPPAGGT